MAVAWAPPAAGAQSNCEGFANRQLGLVDNLLDRNDFERALRVLNTTIAQCDSAPVQEKMGDLFSAWYQAIQNGSAAAQLNFISTATNADNLPAASVGQITRNAAGLLRSLVAARYTNGSYAGAHRLCRSYPRYTDTFRMRIYCGNAAREVQAYASAIQRYEAALDNWNSGASFTTWTQVADHLNEVYMITTRFDAAFALSKRLAIRNTNPSYLLATLTSVRGRFLEPIVEMGRVVFDGMTASAALSYINSEIRRIQYPPYIQSIYLMTSGGASDAILMGQDATATPAPTLLDNAVGNVSLLEDKATGRAWLLTPIDAGYFVVQYGTSTTPEETVLLENLLEDVNRTALWRALYETVFETVYPSMGSTVATLLGGSYLANTSLARYHPVFGNSALLLYSAIQTSDGTVTRAYEFSRDRVQYPEGAWDRTSKTPALFYQTVQYEGAPIREVVWPLYDGDTWKGVIRIGIAVPEPV